MNIYKINKNNYIFLIILILFVSFTTNVYTSIVNIEYKEVIGEENYKSIEEIRNRNEKNLNLLNQCINTKSASNEEILALYKNYCTLSDEFTKLWSNYWNYENRNILNLKSKNIYMNKLPSNTFEDIEALLYEYLILEMKNKNEKIQLTGKNLDNFLIMLSLSQDINNYLIDFNTNNYKKDINEEKKIKQAIKNKHWLINLSGIDDILEEYLDYEFIL